MHGKGPPERSTEAPAEIVAIIITNLFRRSDHGIGGHGYAPTRAAFRDVSAGDGHSGSAATFVRQPKYRQGKPVLQRRPSGRPPPEGSAKMHPKV